MSLIEDRESFASKLARITARIDADLARLADPKHNLDRDWGRPYRYTHDKKSAGKPKRVRGDNPHWEQW